MKTSIKFLYLLVLVITLFVLYNSIFTVFEGQQALVLRLGKLQKNSQGQPNVMLPGLHFKVPFITRALIFDTRIQTLDIESSRIVTAEKKDVLVDYYVKWRIADLAKYYKSTGGNFTRAEILLQQQVNGSLRAQFGRRTISAVVSDQRSAIMLTLRHETDQSAAPLGVKVIDVRIKAIDLPTEVSSAVFSRMRAERQRVAAEHRAQGKSLAEAIRAKADAEATVTIAKANQQAAQLHANGNKQAAQIYAQAYSNAPQFYAFYRSLQAYQNTFRKRNDIMVLSPHSQFFKYMNTISN